MTGRSSLFEPAWQAAADAAGVGPGTALLDLGCGTGRFCAFAADRGAVVHGLDSDPEALAEALGRLPGAEFRLGLMESVPWPDESFDVVTAFNALQYALDTELALRDAFRVTRPGGRVAVCKWGPPAGNQFFAFLTSLGARGIRAEDLPAFDPVHDAIRSQGRHVIMTDDVPAPIEMSDLDALHAALVQAGIDETDELEAAAARYRLEDGSYCFDNRLSLWVISA